MKKLAVLSTAALLGLGAMTASKPAEAWHWGHHHHHHHRGGAVAAGLIGGLAAGALIGAAASSAYAAPAYYPSYGYAPAYYGEPAPVVVRRRVVRRVHYAPVRRRVVVYDDAPVYRTRVVRRVPAYGYGYAPAYYPAYWGGPSVSVGFGFGRTWW